MKLNLSIIKEQLPEFEFEDSQYDAEGVFNLSDVHLCTKQTKDMQTGVAYIIESKLLPERKNVYRLPTVICIGKPPVDWISSKTNILYTTKKGVDPQTVYDKVTAVFYKYEKIEEELANLLDRNEDLSCLDKFIPKYITNPLNIINSAYEPIFQYFPKLEQSRLTAVKSIPNYDFYYSGEQRVISNSELLMHSTDRRYRGILKASNPSLYRMLGTGINLLFQNIILDSNRIGYMEIIEFVNPIKTSDYLLLTILSNKLSYWFRVNSHIISTEDDIGALTHALLRDKTLPSGRITYTLEKNGWKESDDYVLFLITNYRGSMSIPKVDFYLHGLLSKNYSIGHTVFDDYLVIIFNLTKSKQTRETLLDDIRRFQDPTIALTLSVEYTPIQNSYSAFTQSRTLSKLGTIMHFDTPVFTLDEFMMDYFLFKIRRQQIIENICPANLKKLRSYDQSKGTDYVHLLKIYLDSERSITETSQQAFLHRNTTMYQINKIQEIMNTDFSSPDERIILQLVIREMEKEVPDVSEININQLF